MIRKTAGITTLLLIQFAVALFTGCGEQRTISSEDVEYRKDKNGVLLLYKISEEEPLTAKVVEFHPNKKRHFEINFVNGLRDGNFTFWRENEMPMLKGIYRQGKRHGAFVATGKAGELVYAKTYKEGRLNGPCKFYYPYSEDDVESFFQKMNDEDLEIGELKANPKIRFSCEFVDDVPTGTYKSYYHRREDTNSTSTEELLRELGNFDENGGLVSNQDFYFPMVKKLGVKLPTGKMQDKGFDASIEGLSSAMRAAYVAIEELPAYRNREGKPAEVFALDERGNEIAPVWKTNIFKIAIRDLNKTFLPKRYDTTFEAYNRAKQRAEDLRDEHGLSASENTEASLERDIEEFAETTGKRDKTAIEVLGLNKQGKVIEVLWTSDSQSHVIPLEERISKKRKRLFRAWLDGKSWGTKWYLSNGRNISIVDKRRRQITKASREEKPKE